MPQTTLGKNMKISSSPPASSKPRTPKKNTKLTPGVALAKSQGSQGVFGGKASTLEDDLEALGLPKDYLKKVHGKDVKQGRKGNKEAQDDVNAEEVEEGEKHQDELDKEKSGDAKRGKKSNYAPTGEDVDMEDPDHQQMEKDVQEDIPEASEKGNASKSHTAKTKNGKASEGGGLESGEQVTGAKEGRGKKRAASPDEGGVAGSRGKNGSTEEGGRGKKRQKNAYEIHGKVAHPTNAARVDREPPYERLMKVQEELWGYKADEPALSEGAKQGTTPKKGKGKDTGDGVKRIKLKKAGEDGVEKGEAVAYWMRLEDMRVVDNRALSLASDFAQQNDLPLIVLFTIVPGDYKAHDRSARKLDFILRNLRHVRSILIEQNIPLYIHNHTGNRFELPRTLIEKVLPDLGVTHIFGNVEYEVDELRRDIEVVELGAKGKNGKGKVKAMFVHDRLAVPPGLLLTGKGTPFGVFSPWMRKWQAFLDSNPEYLYEAPEPQANDDSIKKHKVFGKLLEEDPIPDYVDGYERTDKELMSKIWPEGSDAAMQVLNRFIYYPSRKQDLGLVDPKLQGGDKSMGDLLSSDAPEDEEVIDVDSPKKKSSKSTKDEVGPQSRLRDYASGRNSADANTSSRMSPYLAVGAISIRMVLNKIIKVLGGKLESGRDSGPGTWVMECAWRDFYNHVMACFPRVSMGRPFLEKFSDVQWEVVEDKLQAWKDGRTGYPIVDAAMRQCKFQGWMHNRPRMICASFLVKDLMLDWRLGERYFMENFIVGWRSGGEQRWMAVISIPFYPDLGFAAKAYFSIVLSASTCASTGTDPQPYFRIFNPFSQSETASPDGAYIRYWVPELKNVPESALHNPHGKLSSKDFAKLGYPEPIVDHAKARARALARYKNPGYRGDEGDDE